jgi:hypothetical protein
LVAKPALTSLISPLRPTLGTSFISMTFM